MVRLATYTWGNSRHTPVVCLHGIGAYGMRYRDLAEDRLAASHYVVSIDLRGHGNSSFDPPWNLQTHLSDILETLDYLGIEKAVWVGHSFGGRLALEASASSSNCIAASVLLDPAIEVSPQRAREGADSERQEKTYDTREQAVLQRIESGFVRESSRHYLEEEADIHLEPTNDGRFRPRYEQSAAVTAWGECASPLPAGIQIPTLLITGAQSGFVTEQQKAILRGRLGSMLKEVTVPGGHIVLWDGYQETARAIEEFLQSVAGG